MRNDSVGSNRDVSTRSFMRKQGEASYADQGLSRCGHTYNRPLARNEQESAIMQCGARMASCLNELMAHVAVTRRHMAAVVRGPHDGM